jgi:hypothetical protein
MYELLNPRPVVDPVFQKQADEIYFAISRQLRKRELHGVRTVDMSKFDFDGTVTLVIQGLSCVEYEASKQFLLNKYGDIKYLKFDFKIYESPMLIRCNKATKSSYTVGNILFDFEDTAGLFSFFSKNENKPAWV